METPLGQLRNIADYTTAELRALIASERERGKAFGYAAEMARHELARRGEQA